MSYNKVLLTRVNSIFPMVHNKIQRVVSLSGNLAGKPVSFLNTWTFYYAE